jgi:hypothetical protein
MYEINEIKKRSRTSCFASIGTFSKENRAGFGTDCWRLPRLPDSSLEEPQTTTPSSSKTCRVPNSNSFCGCFTIRKRYPSSSFESKTKHIRSRRYSLYDTSVDEWTKILELAHRWKFEEVKDLVIRELEKMDMSPIDRINLYHRYDVDKNILLPRYTSICVREDHLSVGEGRQLGIETALNLAQIRERVRSTPTEGYSPCLTEGDVYAIIKEVFAISELSTPASETASGRRDANGTSGSTGASVVSSRRHFLVD